MGNGTSNEREIHPRPQNCLRFEPLQNTTFNGINVYEWQDHATAPPNRYFVTMDANEYPVALGECRQGGQRKRRAGPLTLAA